MKSKSEQKRLAALADNPKFYDCEKPICMARMDKLRLKLQKAEAVVQALRSVLSEEGVREHLSAYVMGVETMNRLQEYDATEKAT